MSPALANQSVSITMPLFRWLMLIGVLGSTTDQAWYDTLVDQVLDVVQP